MLLHEYINIGDGQGKQVKKNILAPTEQYGPFALNRVRFLHICTTPGIDCVF